MAPERNHCIKDTMAKTQLDIQDKSRKVITQLPKSRSYIATLIQKPNRYSIIRILINQNE